VDDARIQALTAEVLADLRAPAAASPPAGGKALEARVAALEAAVRSLIASPQGGIALAPTALHPSLRLLGPSGGGDACVLEPDKPCVGSGQCRTFGH
jgi:hypothetical protein